MTRGRHGTRVKQLRAEVRERGEPCCRCGRAIDYTLAWPHPRSYSMDHYPHDLTLRPDLAEDLDNLAAAHLVCNQSAGGKRPNKAPPDVGVTSRQW